MSKDAHGVVLAVFATLDGELDLGPQVLAETSHQPHETVILLTNFLLLDVIFLFPLDEVLLRICALVEKVSLAYVFGFLLLFLVELFGQI